MKYPYHDFYETLFEDLIVAICQEILGMGVQSFSKGPDGGRDARFNGTAECFPSSTKPHNGKFIIQAKHTDNPIAKVSEKPFSGESESSIVSKEIKKIKLLKENNEIDHYIIFTNRKASGNAVPKIENKIISSTNIKTAHLIGIDGIEKYLKAYPDIPINLDLSPVNMPLRVSPDEIAEVILKISNNNDSFKEAFESIPERVDLSSKNKANNLSSQYSSSIEKHIKDFACIKNFLGDPQNKSFQDMYVNSSEEFNAAIIAKRNDFQKYDDVLQMVISLLIGRDSDLSKNRRLTRLIIYYMYWNCDLG